MVNIGDAAWFCLCSAAAPVRGSPARRCPAHTVHALRCFLRLPAAPPPSDSQLGRVLSAPESRSRACSTPILAVHPLGDAAGGCVQRLQLILGGLQAQPQLLIFPVHRLRLGVELVQRRHPGGDLHARAARRAAADTAAPSPPAFSAGRPASPALRSCR